MSDPLLQRYPELKSILFSREEIDLGVQKLAQRINRHYAGKEILLIAILKGTLIFVSDLMRHLDLDVQLDFYQASSYRDSQESGDLQLRDCLQLPIKDRHVLLIDDIIDTGKTFAVIFDLLQAQAPASLASCACFRKSARRKNDFKLDFFAFEIEDEFVVGYGLDFNERFRQLPFLAVCGGGEGDDS